MENFLTILTKITNKARPDAIYPHFFVVKILIHFLTLPQFFNRSILKKKTPSYFGGVGTKTISCPVNILEDILISMCFHISGAKKIKTLSDDAE